MKSDGKIFCSSVLAGIVITLGASVNLAVDNRYIGAMLLSIGLFCVCMFDWRLFTADVCDICENKEILSDLLIIWSGNVLGVALSSIAVIVANPSISVIAQSMWEEKSNVDLVNLFFAAICCSFLIYIAVNGYKKIQNAFGKCSIIFISVMVLVLCNFEDSIIDISYFLLALCPATWRSFWMIFMISIGNVVGGLLFSILNKIAN